MGKLSLLNYFIIRLNRMNKFYESTHDHLHTSMAVICTRETFRVFPTTYLK